MTASFQVALFNLNGKITWNEIDNGAHAAELDAGGDFPEG